MRNGVQKLVLKVGVLRIVDEHTRKIAGFPNSSDYYVNPFHMHILKVGCLLHKDNTTRNASRINVNACTISITPLGSDNQSIISIDIVSCTKRKETWSHKTTSFIQTHLKSFVRPSLFLLLLYTINSNTKPIYVA